MKRSFFVFIALVATLTAAPTRAVVNGREPAPDSPLSGTTVVLQAQLGNGGKWWFICSGVIWDEHLILTAGHCAPQGSGKVPMRVVFSADLAAPELETGLVTGFRIHDGFHLMKARKHDDRDIALLSFQGSLPAGFHPVAPLPEDVSPREGAMITLGGFGETEMSRRDYGMLREVEVPLADSAFSATEGRVEQRAGGGCHGDSGGPAFVRIKDRYYLWGIASRLWPMEPEDCLTSMLYTRIDAYREWIDETARILEP